MHDTTRVAVAPTTHVAARTRHRTAWTIVVAGLGHRVLVFLTQSDHLDALIAANPDWCTFQYLPIPLLRDRLAASILYLQQTPPLPNLILGIVLKWFSWPYGVAHALIALQALISIATALVLMRTLMMLFRGHAWASAIVAITFLLTTDLLVIEYNSFGQTFYENLSMLFVACLANRLLCFHRSGEVRHAFQIGVLTGALALTRSTWTFFWIPAALAVALAAGPARRRVLLAFALPVLLLQGGWILKTRVVYGHWTLTTTSWTGYHLARALWIPNTGPAFKRFAAETDAGRDSSPLCKAFTPLTALHLHTPDSIDQHIALRLGTPNPAPNRSSTRRYLDGCSRLSVRFFFAHPGWTLRRVWSSYRLFWLPPAQYGRMLVVAPLSPEAPLRTGLSPGAVLQGLWNGRLPARQFALSGTWQRRRFIPTRFFTVRWLDPFILLATMIGVHALAPLALIRRVAPRGTHSDLLLLLLPYVYLASVSSVGEYGENMRFREAIEPVVWLITIQSAAMCGYAWFQRASSSGPPMPRHSNPVPGKHAGLRSSR